MTTYRNRYYAFRHGQSRANVEGIIISDPATGTLDYGLTEQGRRQVLDSLSSTHAFNENSLIMSSDFLRARETAHIIQEQLGAPTVQLDERLRERFFGQWEGQPHDAYAITWKRDEFDPDREYDGAESSRAVQRRMWSVIQSLEEAWSDRTILLVSHGDPLMLLQTAFNHLGPDRHRSLPYIKTAGHRRLNP